MSKCTYTPLHKAYIQSKPRICFILTQVLEDNVKTDRPSTHSSQKGSKATWETCSTEESEQKSKLTTDTNLSKARSRVLRHGVGRTRQAGKEQAGSGG